MDPLHRYDQCMTHNTPATDHQTQKAAVLKFTYEVAIPRPVPKTTLKRRVGYVDEELSAAREKVQRMNIDPKATDENKDGDAEQGT